MASTVDTKQISEESKHNEEAITEKSSDTAMYKYFCKFWMEDTSRIKGECKLQQLDSQQRLFKELEERSILENGILTSIEAFTTDFNSETSDKVNQAGIAHKQTEEKASVLEKWNTNFEKNTYDKESQIRSGSTSGLEKSGKREGRNEAGELWFEEWNMASDGSHDGWKRRNEKFEGSSWYKWGEGEDSLKLATEQQLQKHRWQEKLENNDYWEKLYELDTTHIISERRLEDTQVVRSGVKEFENNCGYRFKEEWNELRSGEVLVERTRDDGKGNKETESLKAKKNEHDELEYEQSEKVIEDIGNDKWIVLESVKKGEQEEWENKRIINFKENFETVSKRGSNPTGRWQEEWSERDQVRWARKEGENFITKDKWKEEWTEKQKEEVVEKQCEKWAQNGQGEEWTERWGEHFSQGKREKWADKWFIDWNSGFRRGESWGHEYDTKMQPVHHWCEYWNTEGHNIRRDEHYQQQ